MVLTQLDRVRHSILNFQIEDYSPKVLDVKVSKKCCLDSLASHSCLEWKIPPKLSEFLLCGSPSCTRVGWRCSFYHLWFVSFPWGMVSTSNILHSCRCTNMFIFCWLHSLSKYFISPGTTRVFLIWVSFVFLIFIFLFNKFSLVLIFISANDNKIMMVEVAPSLV